MDKKTIIGLLLMVAVFVGYSFYVSSEQEKVAQTTAELNKPMDQYQIQKEAELKEQQRIKSEEELAKHGLNNRSEAESEIIDVKNNYMTISFDTKGGKITGAELNNYTRYAADQRNELVNLIKPGSAYFGIDLQMGENAFNTDDFIFDCIGPIASEDGTSATVIMTLPLDELTEEDPEHAYIKYIYTINNTGDESKDYLVDFDLEQKNLEKYLVSSNEIILWWRNKSMHNEKSFTNESTASTIMFYSHSEDESDEIEADGSREHHRNLDWIALKQQYFSSVLIAKSVVHGGLCFWTGDEKNPEFVKNFEARVIIPHAEGQLNHEFAFYYGPNDYNVLSNITFQGRDYHVDEIIPMGGWLIGWLNRYLTIPIFNWLKDNGLGFGLIILILTLIVKLIILPLTYKSYMSTAKMRAIRPEMEEINKKYPNKDDAMKKQQALMELYRKAGVSPMGGCLPLLIQMPILWAMFRFFPASIELRGESFLWADDLSSYDSVLDLPFSIPFYGDHVSLFALLMAISLFGYSYMSYKQQAATTAGQPGAGVMKFMMVYFMPVMMLFFFNSYSSGLCYYYFLSQMFTMLIMYIIRRSVDDNKVRERLLANASKPRKKSKFQQRYEELLKQQQEQLNREQRRQRR